MSSKWRKIESRIVFCEILSVLLLIGLSAGFAWGENHVCSGCHHSSLANLISLEWIHHQSHPDNAWGRQQAFPHISEEVLTGASVTEERFNEQQAERVRIIRILLIGTVIGAMLFLGRCL